MKMKTIKIRIRQFLFVGLTFQFQTENCENIVESKYYFGAFATQNI